MKLPVHKNTVEQLICGNDSHHGNFVLRLLSSVLKSYLGSSVTKQYVEDFQKYPMLFIPYFSIND